MYDGVMFQSPEFTAMREEESGKTDRKYRFCIVCGVLTNDPKIQHVNKTRVSFNIKYYTNQYLNIVLWGDTEASYAARMLEKGDQVLCAGTITYSKYIARSGPDKGKQKEWHDLNCQWIVAMSWITALIEMFSAKSIQKLLQSEQSDVMESTEDHYSEYAETGVEESEEYNDSYDYEMNI